MYVGRIVAIGRNRAGRVSALYRVSSRSFPNRQAKVIGPRVAIVPKPGHEGDIFKNPYIAYNCAQAVGPWGVVTNGSHTDFVAEKLAAGYGPRDALASVLLAMDFEHDSLNTPRIAALVGRDSAQGYLGIVTATSLQVLALDLAPGTAYYVTTYEKNVVTAANVDGAFDADSAAAACDYVLRRGVFADFEKPVTAACLVATASGYDLAIADI